MNTIITSAAVAGGFILLFVILPLCIAAGTQSKRERGDHD